jgi:glyoxylase-like metal-dependent hydrolase (beta-lactamase superfamily II)
MNIVKIKGETYYIKDATNVGVYVFTDSKCLLIDTCFTRGQARKIDITLKKNNIYLKYIINTHTHLDHCRGNKKPFRSRSNPSVICDKKPNACWPG